MSRDATPKNNGKILKKNILIVSQRAHSKWPGMCCVVEMEDVLVKEFDARFLDPQAPLPDGDLSGSIALFTAIAYKSIDRYIDFLFALKERGVIVLVYVFDSWDAPNFFYNRNRKLKARFAPKYRIQGFCDRLLVPFQASVEEFSSEDRGTIVHMPLGVDAELVDGLNDNRPLTVLAYGRQPADVTRLFSERLNARGTPFFMHHTDHVHVGDIHEYYAHRRHFWKLAELSAVALAYDPKETHGHRFPYSIIGQRWYESLAAGCAVVGIRPRTPEADTVLDWQDATLEAPSSPEDTLEFVLELASDPLRLKEIRERNVEHIKARHDWRVRFRALFDTLETEQIPASIT